MVCALCGAIPRIVIKMFLIGHNGIFTSTLKDTSSVKLKCKNTILVLKWVLVVSDCILAADNCGLKFVELKCSLQHTTEIFLFFNYPLGSKFPLSSSPSVKTQVGAHKQFARKVKYDKVSPVKLSQA